MLKPDLKMQKLDLKHQKLDLPGFLGSGGDWNSAQNKSLHHDKIVQGDGPVFSAYRLEDKKILKQTAQFPHKITAEN